MNTDLEWEKWGRQDPYFGVITWDRFRAGKLDDQARAEFFVSGQSHVDHVLHACRSYIDPSFAPDRVLEFGCGVGRLLIPFAAVAGHVVGVDVSPSMLAEARKNCAERGIGNVAFALSDDDLTQVQGEFDIVHSAIVLQHIEVPRGRRIFQRLLERLAPGGVGALQLTYGKAAYPGSFGQPPAPELATPSQPPGRNSNQPLRAGVRDDDEADAAGASVADPVMLMIPYNLSELAYLMQTAGVVRFHAEFTDHGGELGVFLFFQRPPAPVRL